MADGDVLIDVNGAVATVTLNRADKLNAFNAQQRSSLQNAVAMVEENTAVRVVILKGAGKGFSAGADLAAGMPDALSFHLDYVYKPALTAIASSEKIWIAQVHGPAAGIGAAFAMTCDLMTMSEEAYIYMAFAAISLVPDGGNTQLLLNALGYSRAMEMILEGQRMGAEDCKAAGICNRVFAADALEAETAAWAKHLSERAPLALSATKRLLRSVGSMSFGDAISAEGREQIPLLRSADFQEGVRAFFAKEKPKFEGR